MFFLSVVINYSDSAASITVSVDIIGVLMRGNYFAFFCAYVTFGIAIAAICVFNVTHVTTNITIGVAFVVVVVVNCVANVSAAFYVTSRVARVAIFVHGCTSVLTALNVTIIITIVAELVYNIS